MQSRSSFTYPLLTLAATVVAATALIGSLLTSASGASPAPTYLVVTGVSSTLEPPDGTPTNAVPSVLVEAGQEFTVDVAFFDELDRPASFNKDTRLTLTANTPDTNQPVEVDWTVAAGLTTDTLTTKLASAANQVRITVSLPGRKGALMSDAASDEDVFDVLKEIRFSQSRPNFRQGIGGANGDCTEATTESPVCGVVILPLGAASPQVLLSLGACDKTYAGCAGTAGSVVQTLADFGDLYSKDTPKTILIKCDKTLCKTGRIQDKVVNFSADGNDALTALSACPAKNTVGSEPACIDYVQSNRDGSGDTHFYVLIGPDARVSVR